MVDNDDSDGDEKGQVTVVTRTMKYTMTMTINSANEKMMRMIMRMIMMMMPREKLFGNYGRPKPEWWRGRGQQGQQPRTAQQVST